MSFQQLSAARAIGVGGVRRRMLLKSGGGLAVAALAGSWAGAQTAKITLKLAITLQETHPTVVALKGASADIAKESNNRVAFEVYPNGQLGSETDTVAQTRSGAIDFVATGGDIWGNLVPAAFLSNIAFAFPDYDTVWKAMDGDLGAYIQGAFEKLNLVQFGKNMDHGFRQVTTSTKLIASPQDFVGLKIRVPASSILTTLFKGLAASPATIAFNELYTALQTRIVDGQENALPTIDSAKLYEVQKYCTLTSHIWDPIQVVANKRNWQQLPEEVRTLITRIFDAHVLKQRAAFGALNTSLEAKLKAGGMQFGKIDPKPLREVLRRSGYYAEWQKKFGADAWALLEKYSGRLL